LLHCKITIDFIVQCNIYLQQAEGTAAMAGKQKRTRCDGEEYR
jgi:hypothetical protein